MYFWERPLTYESTGNFACFSYETVPDRVLTTLHQSAHILQCMYRYTPFFLQVGELTDTVEDAYEISIGSGLYYVPLLHRQHLTLMPCYLADMETFNRVYTEFLHPDGQHNFDTLLRDTQETRGLVFACQSGGML